MQERTLTPLSVTPFFQVLQKDPRSRARTGILKTPHGEIETPVFMPVGTQATVKTVSSAELEKIGAPIVLANTYHLYLRPQEAVIREAGGLHSFMNWPRPILTDSGGFQIFSLSRLMKVKKEGVEFQSHIDGSKHFLTPEEVVRIQGVLGSDIFMPLDECVKYPAERAEVEKSLPLTYEWAKRSRQAWESAGRLNAYGRANVLFGIVQGGVYPDLRKRAVEELAALDLPGYSIGGLSVGEPTELMYEVLDRTVPLLPEEKPRYLMGVGFPLDLLEAISQGVDMFDCVVPTRNGRNATVFTRQGKLLLRGASYIRDFRPIEEGCPCDACQNHTRAYLRHLFNSEEYLAGRLASLHNLTFFIELLQSIRRAIQDGRFVEFRRDFERSFNQPKE